MVECNYSTHLCALQYNWFECNYIVLAYVHCSIDGLNATIVLTYVHCSIHRWLNATILLTYVHCSIDV
jgi:hypothetical protein